MGKKRSAARRAAATAAVAPAATPSPAVPFDTRAALVDTPPAPAVRESPTTTQQPRVSHEADATRAPRAASPTQPTIDASLDLEPATAEVHAPMPIAIATPQTHERHASDPRPEPDDSPPALTTPTSTSSDVSANSPQQSHISNHADTLSALRAPFPALSIHAAADLATVVDRAGPPNDFFAGPAHLFAHANTCGREPESLAPRTSPAMSVEEIDEDLLDNIIEDAQNAMRIEARREVRVMALKEGQERGWRDGFEEGKRHAKREVRVEEQQRQRAWKDGYEQGRWDGYQEGLEIARTEVSTSSRVHTSVQTDDALRAPSPTTDTSTAASHVDAGVQFSTPPHPFPSLTDSRPPTPADASTTAPLIDTGVQYDPHTPTPRVCIGVQADAPADSPSRADLPPPVPIDMVPVTSHVNAAAQTDDLTPTRETAYADTGVQAVDPPPPFPSDDTHSSRLHIQASAQTDTPSPRASDHPRASVHARARTVHEIEPDLLREILAAAIAKGEAAGLKTGKRVGFQDGMEAGWKSGTREGHAVGYREGRTVGVAEEHEQHRLEVSSIQHAVAVIQTDCSPLPSQTTSVPIHASPLSAINATVPTNTHHCTIISPPVGPVNTPSEFFTISSNPVSMSNNDYQYFSWADDASTLPVSKAVPLVSKMPRDFSILRSSSVWPFDSLKRRARRSQPRPIRPSRPSRPFIPSSEPIITRRHPAGLRADRPAVVVSPSSTISHSVKLYTPPLDWQGDPRLHELGRVLRGLGWVHSSGS